MKRKPQAWLIMWLIAMSAAFLLGTTNEMTSEMIQQRNIEEKEASRIAVFSSADSFSQMQLDETATVDECYAAYSGDELVGYVCTAVEQGYGGPIEVIVGIKLDGSVTGITVGGSRFSETAGLGAKTKEAAFTSQFADKQTPLALKIDIDSVTGASISSGAVVDAVNASADHVKVLSEVIGE